MEKTTETRKLNPLEIIKQLGFQCPEYISFDPNLTKESGAQYEIIRKSTHDGTLIFDHELKWKSLEPLLNKTTYCNKDNLEGVKDIKYTIGMLTSVSEYGLVDLPAGNFPGENQTVSIPVKTELIRDLP